jgi:hypothetical protein
MLKTSKQRIPADRDDVALETAAAVPPDALRA